MLTPARSKNREPSLDELRAWDRQIVWHAFTQMAEYEPLIFESAQGCTLVDVEGRKYLDACASVWCNVHGHRHRRLDAALREQLDKVAHVTSLGSSNSTTIKLAKRLVEIAPVGLGHVFFSDSGATAVEVALKMSLQYWRQRQDPRPNKSTYVALADAYHGDTLGSVSVGGVARFHAMFDPLLFPVLRAPAPDTYRMPAGVTRENALAHYVRQMEELLAREHARVAAVVMEPLIQAAAGMIMHPPGYLAAVRELTRKYDVHLIADEVAVGFGRTGSMFACQQENVTPDFLCLAKGLTGGYMPVAATLTTTEVWNAFQGTYADSKTFFHGHTYGGNPLGCAVGLATLDVFEEEQTLAKLPTKIERLAEHLARISQHPHVGDVRQRGLIGAIELVRDKQTREPFPWEQKRGMAVCDFARGRGVLARPLGSVLVIFPPLSVTLEELDRICTTLEAGIVAVTE